jgi:cyclopropane fatty-acyl-phospholipid synthase-like methyltransferase
LNPGATILDVGCGSGRDLLWFKQRGFNVIGLERSGGLAKLAGENTGSQIIEADFEKYDFSQLSADAIALVGAIVHIPHNKMPEVLTSITRALKKDSNILLIRQKNHLCILLCMCILNYCLIIMRGYGNANTPNRKIS